MNYTMTVIEIHARIPYNMPSLRLIIHYKTDNTSIFKKKTLKIFTIETFERLIYLILAKVIFL